MKKIFVLLLLSIGLAFSAYAQKRIAFGVSAGSGIHNYQAGLLAEVKLSKRLYVQIEGNLFISNKNQDVTIRDTIGNAIESRRLRVNTSYFQTPVLLKYKLGKSGKWFGLMGVSPSFVFNAKMHSGKHYYSVSYNEYISFGGYFYGFEIVESSSNYNSTENLVNKMKPVSNFITLGVGYEKTYTKLTPFIETRIYVIPNAFNVSFWQQPIIGVVRGGVKF